MIKYLDSNINKWYNDDSELIKVYYNGAVCYYKVDSSSPSGQTPCFAVVADITQYSDTEFEDVFNKADGKWYKLNNLNQYEEYGVYASGRTSCESSSRLPQGYTEVEYIENTSSAYINTNLILLENIGDSFEIKVKTYFTPYGNDFEYLFGTEQTSSPYTGIQLRYYKRNLQYSSDSNVVWTHIDNGDGTSGVTASCSSINATNGGNPLTLFCGLWSTGPWRYGRGKIYSFKVTKNNGLVRDFVPCKRDSDDKYGMYDLVTNAFYLSPNNVDFSGGEPVTPTDCVTTYNGKLTIDDGYEYEWNGSSWVNLGEISGSSRVPVGYTEVEYTESSGSQYIDTDAYLDTSNFEIGYTIVGNKQLFGYSHQGKINGTWLGAEQSALLFWGVNDNMANISSYLTSSGNTVTFSPTGATINDTTTISKTLSMGSDSIANIPLLIFARYNFYDNTIEFRGSDSYSKFSSFYLKNNGELVRNFVAAKRDSDNEYGLYDLVSNTFFTSPNGNSFTGGATTTGITVYPVYYDEKSEPPDNLSFSSMTEAESYECPWVGMQANIDGVNYVFSGDSQSGYSWVKKLTAWYTLQDLINTHTVISLGNNKFNFSPEVNGIAFFRVHTDKVSGSQSYVDLYNDNLPSPPYFGIRDDSDIGLYKSVDGYSNLKNAANSTSCTWAYWIDANTIEVNAQAIMNDTMKIGFYSGSFPKLLLSFELPTI